MLVVSLCLGSALRWVRRYCFPILAGLAVVAGARAARAAQPAEPVISIPGLDGLAPDADITNVRFGAAVPEPLWTSYALTDALFWGRDNQASNRPLVIDVDSGAAVISGNDLQFPVAEGVRAFYGRRQPNQGGWEIGYWGLYGQSATRIAGGDIQMPEPIGSRLTSDANSVIVKYASTINSAEANIFSTRNEWRDRSGAWLTDDWLLGFRYVGVEEQSSIYMTCCPEDLPVNYRVQTRNNMFGGQVGRRMRWTWNSWALEGWAKAGLLGNSQEGIQPPLIDYTGTEQRQAYSYWRGQVGFIGDINLSAIYRINDVWGIRAGYNLIWIDGLALAPNQFDFSVDVPPNTGVVSGGGIFLSGANLGLEARW
jgi:hypothetical protein